MTAQRSTMKEKAFFVLSLLAVILPLLLLLALVSGLAIKALPRLQLEFLSSYPSRRAESAGILPGLVGTLYMVGLTTAMALPVGVGAAIYLEEYGRRGRLARLVEINIANLAGVPSVIYGLLGLSLFVRTLGLGRSLLAGSLTMALLVLPVVILTAREALRLVPMDIREACYSMGATRWQAIRQVILPIALPGILTGSILAVSRAVGETAPLIVIGALTYVAFLPDGLDSPFTVLPIQIFNWVSRPQPEFTVNAAAGIVVLLATTLLLNATAILLRNRYQKRVD